jgi:myosin heavy subunit
MKDLRRVDPQCMDTSIDDLIRLNSLSENSLLHILRGRFATDVIYTYVSSILIAVNPFKALEIYNDEAIETYRTSSDKAQLSPHIFGTTDAVYRGMLATSMPHSIIISGESGAG